MWGTEARESDSTVRSHVCGRLGLGRVPVHWDIISG